MRGINLKLHGQFKFDLYGSGGNLISGGEYVDNFITNSGVMYPYHFAFADCFRYLSVGASNYPNSIISSGGIYVIYPPTTGLNAPISNYSYIGSRSSWDGGTPSSYYAQPGNLGAGCGYVNLPNGVSLIRQWNLPDGTGGFFTSSQTFQEFMVSPGRPYVTGLNGVKFCSCSESDAYATGKDCSATADYYMWLADKYQTTNRVNRLNTCDATKAFARVLNTVPVTSGSILVVTYKLNVIIDTGIYQNNLYYNRGDANPNWNGNLNFYNSITNPGVMLINDGIVASSRCPNSKERLQHFDYTSSQPYRFDYEYGESFVPPKGIPLEPSHFFLLNDKNNQNISVYISDDNTQFLVNPTGGCLKPTGKYAPWNFWTEDNLFTTYQSGDIVWSGNTSYMYVYVNPSSGHQLDETTYWSDMGYLKSGKFSTSGVKPFVNDNDATLTDSSYWYRSNEFNIRTTSGTAPNPDDITQEVGMNASYFAATKASLPTFQFPSTVSSSGIRNTSVTYSYSFENYRGISALRARSLVAAYKDLSYGTSFGLGDTVNLIPFFDVVFSGINGSSNVWLPSLRSGQNIVNGNTGVVLDNVGDLNYNTISSETNAIYPIINTRLSWSVPCPQAVFGC